MNFKRLSIPMTVLLISISLFAGFYMSAATAFQYNPSTYTYFNKIAEQPHIYHKNFVSTEDFWKEGGDCDERANAFKEYVISKGGSNIQIIKARNIQKGEISPDPTGSYGHTFVLWNDRVYNPALNKSVRFYGADFNEYKKLLTGDYYGVNTLYYENGTVESLYS